MGHSVNVDSIKMQWSELSDEEKACLLPVLLNSIVAWHGWSLNDLSRLDWLENQFEKAGLPFRSSYPSSK